VLIDFGFAEFIPQAYGTDEKIPRRETLNRLLLSPWHLEGYRIGRRDDLYRVMESTASLLGLSYDVSLDDKFISALTKGITQGVKMKKNFFDSDVDKKGGIYCCPGTSKTEPLTHMKKAMDMILGMNHPDQRPEYEKIIRELNMALFSLDPGTAELLEELLIEDTTPLPNGPSSYGRQIVQIDESEFPEDPLKEFGGRNKISRGTT